jgi:hypothetical protein
MNKRTQKSRQKPTTREKREAIDGRPLSNLESRRANSVIDRLDADIRKLMAPTAYRLGFLSDEDRLSLFVAAAWSLRDLHYPTVPFDEFLLQAIDRLSNGGEWIFKSEFCRRLSRHMYRFAQDELEYFRSIQIPNELLPSSERKDDTSSTRFWIRNLTEAYTFDHERERHSIELDFDLQRVRFLLSQTVIRMQDDKHPCAKIAEFLLYGAVSCKTCLMEDPAWETHDVATIANYCDIHNITRKQFERLRERAKRAMRNTYELLDEQFLAYFEGSLDGHNPNAY